MQNNPYLPEQLDAGYTPLGILDYINPLADNTPPEVGGVPSFGTGGGSGEAADPVFASMQKRMAQAPSEETQLRPVRFDWDQTRADRYVNADTDTFQALGFKPWGDNEELYAQHQTWGDTMQQALGGAWKLGATTFIDGWKGWGRAVDALFSWDASKLMGSTEELAALHKEQNDIMNKYAIFSSKENEDGIFNRQFFGSMLQQGGFMLGTLAQFVSEELLTMGASTLLSGAMKGTKLLRGSSKLYDVAEMTKDLKKIGDVWKDGNFMKQTFRALKEALPGAKGTLGQMRKAYNAGAGVEQLAYLGIGGLKRSFAEANMAFTEARMEAAGTYGDLREKMLADYEARTGKNAAGEDLKRIDKLAETAAWDNFKINSAVLATMNRIQFDNLFAKFRPDRLLMQKAAEEAVEQAGKQAFKVSGKVGDKMITKAYETSEMFGRLGAVGEIAKDFGKKKAAIEAAKSVGKGLMKWEGSEGLQEMIQEGSNTGVQDYYYDLYKTGKANSSKSFQEGLNSQLNNQGFKTFLMGAFTGTLMSPVSFAMNKGVQLATTKKADRDAQAASVKESIQTINEFFANPGNIIKEQNANVKVQGTAAQTMQEAIQNRDKYQYENTKDSALAKAVAAAKKLNMLPSLLDNLTSYGEHFTEEEFKEAFGVEFNETNRRNVKEYTQNIAAQVKEYSDTYDRLMERFSDVIMPELYKEGSQGYAQATFAKHMVHEAIEVLATNNHKAKRAYERMMEVQNRAASNPRLGASLADAFRTLTSSENITSQLALLEDELKTLNDAPNKDMRMRAEVRAKQTQINALKAWKEYHNNFSLNGRVEAEMQAKAEQGFRLYMNSVNGEFDRHYITEEDVSENMKGLEDVIRLNKDSQSYTDAFNKLANPTQFSAFYAKMKHGAERAVQQMRHDAINETLSSKIGFAKKHKDLFDEIKRLQEGEKTPEAIQRYNEIVEELADKADQYDDTEARQAVNAIKISPEFRGAYGFFFRQLEMLSEALREAMSQDEAEDIQARIQNIEAFIEKLAINEYNNQPEAADTETELPEGSGEAGSGNAPSPDGASPTGGGSNPQGGTPQRPTGPVVTLAIDDPVFVKQFNTAIQDALQEIAAAIQKEVSEKELTDLLDKHAAILNISILNQLKPEDQAAMSEELRQAMMNVHETYKKFLDSKNPDVYGKVTFEILNTLPLTDVIPPLVAHFNSNIHHTRLKEARKTVEIRTDAIIREVVAKLKQPTTDASPAHEKVTKAFEQSLTGVKGVIEDFQKDAAKVEAGLQGLNMRVDVPENFSTSVNTGIQSNSWDGEASAGQVEALQNLLRSGMITAEEMQVLENDKTRKTASELINRAVGRIHLVTLNKMINDWMKTRGSKDELRKAYEAYLKNLLNEKGEYADPSTLKTEIDATMDGIDLAKERETVFTIMELPQTAMISDEQFKSLKQLSYKIGEFQKASNLLSLLEKLQAEQEHSKETRKDVASYMKFEQGKSGMQKLVLLDGEIEALQALVDQNLYTQLDNEIKRLVNEYGKNRYNSKQVDEYAAKAIEGYILSKLKAPAVTADDTVLTADQLDALIKAPVPVSDGVRAQVEARMQEHKAAIMAAVEKTDGMDFTINLDGFEPLPEPEEEAPAPQYIGGRPKSAADIRMAEDLIDEYQTSEGGANVHHALRNIMNSDFATDSEKALAEELLKHIHPDEEMHVVRGSESKTGYSPFHQVIFLNMDQLGFDDESGQDGLPIEAVILHELVHQLTYDAIEHPDGKFARQLQGLYNLAKKEAEEKGLNFYAMSVEKEGSRTHLHEFVTETFTSPAFQHHLSKITYANSNKSVWQKFLDIIREMFNVLGLKVSNNVLNEVIGLTTNMLEQRVQDSKNAEAQEKSRQRYQAYEGFLNELPTHNTVEALEDMLKRVKKELPASPNRDSLLKSIENRIGEVKVLNKREQLKSMTPVSVSGKTYYIRLGRTGQLEVYRPTRRGFSKVTAKTKGAEKIFNELVRSAEVNSFLPVDVINRLKDLVTEGRHAFNVEAKVEAILGSPSQESTQRRKQRLLSNDPQSFEEEVLQFFIRGGKLQTQAFTDMTGYGAKRQRGLKAGTTKGSADLKAFRWALAEDGVKPDQWIQEIADKWGISQGDEYDFVQQVVDILRDNESSTNMMERLEELQQEPDPFDQFGPPPADLDDSLRNNFIDAVAATLSQRLGVPIQRDAAEAMVNRILPSATEEEVVPEPEATEVPVTHGPTVVYDGTSFATDNSDMQFEGAEDTIGARNKNAFRSTSNDIKVEERVGRYEEVEMKDFEEQYGKVRNVINRLYENGNWNGYQVTLIPDNSAFRWDGSERFDSPTSLIGYISDENGNAIIFDEKGEVVRTVPRSEVGNAKLGKGANEQIVYFPIIEKDKGMRNFNQLQQKRTAIQDGIVHIADISRLTPGVMNLGVKGKSGSRQWNTTQGQLSEDVSQPHVRLTMGGRKGSNVQIVVSDAAGVEQSNTAFMPNTGQIRFVDAYGNPRDVVDYVVDLMEARHEMFERMKAGKLNPKEFWDINTKLVNYIRNLVWFTGDMAGLKFTVASGKDDNNFNAVMIRKDGDKEGTNLRLFKQENGKLVRDANQVELLRAFTKNRKLHAHAESLGKYVEIPYVVLQNGEKSLNFVVKDYNDFLLKEIGLFTYISKIPAQDQIKRYNSIVEFAEPKPLEVKEVPSLVGDDTSKIENIKSVTNDINIEGLKGLTDADLGGIDEILFYPDQRTYTKKCQ